MHDPDDRRPPAEALVNPLPVAVIVLVLGILAVEATLSLASRGILGGAAGVGWRIDAVRDFAVLPQILDMMAETGQVPLRHLLRLLTYPFVHVAFTAALFSSVMLLALGKWVGEAMGSLAVAVIFGGAGVVGALAYWLLAPGGLPLTGAFPPVYGLIGAYTWMLWVRLGAVGQKQARAFTLIGFLMGLQLAFGLLFGRTDDWIADLAGFATGFAAAPLLFAPLQLGRGCLVFDRSQNSRLLFHLALALERGRDLLRGAS